MHDLCTRYMRDNLLADLHVMVEPLLSVRDGHRIAHLVEEKLLLEGPTNLIDVLVHVEPFGEE